jgi:ribonuclease HI
VGRGPGPAERRGLVVKAYAVCDGRGNAGTGARACVMYAKDPSLRGLERRFARAERLEPCTNIVAEHLAIQLAVEMALDNGVTHLEVLNDSQTPVGHILGEYQVEAEHLKPIVARTWELARLLEDVSIRWVPRSETKEADALCRRVDRPEPQVMSPFRKTP